MTHHDIKTDHPTDTLAPFDGSFFDLAAWGLADAAYVKLVTVDNEMAWAIYTADGQAIGVAPARDLAFAAIVQQDMCPYSVH